MSSPMKDSPTLQRSADSKNRKAETVSDNVELEAKSAQKIEEEENLRQEDLEKYKEARQAHKATKQKDVSDSSDFKEKLLEFNMGRVIVRSTYKVPKSALKRL